MAADASSAGFQAPNDVTFISDVDGTSQKYVELLPAAFDARKEYSVMLAFHGHGADRWQYIRDSRGECRGARDVAARYGMIFIAPDYRACCSWMGPAAEADVLQILDDLKQKYRIDKVVLVGGSMGGTSVLTFGILHPDRVDAVSSQNGLANHVDYVNFQDAISASFGGSRDAAPEEYRKRSAEFFPDRLTMPIAVTTGGMDTDVPPASVLRLAAKLKDQNRNVLVIHREATGHETNYEDTVTAVEFAVRGALG